jgi:hypothetical protein
LVCASGRAYWFSFSVFPIALALLAISWTWDESMAKQAPHALEFSLHPFDFFVSIHIASAWP